jgi:HEAT repeat protein
MRAQVIFVASQRNDPAAVDLLMRIAENDPNEELQSKAVFWLGQTGDPRVPEFLLKLINRPDA